MADALVISGMRRLDFLDLQRTLAAQGVEIKEEREANKTYGELGTVTALIVFGPPLLVILAAWLLSKKEHTTIGYKFHRKNADGSSEQFEINLDFSKSEPPDEKILKQLVKSLQVGLKVGNLTDIEP